MKLLTGGNLPSQTQSVIIIVIPLPHMYRRASAITYLSFSKQQSDTVFCRQTWMQVPKTIESCSYSMMKGLTKKMQPTLQSTCLTVEYLMMDDFHNKGHGSKSFVHMHIFLRSAVSRCLSFQYNCLASMNRGSPRTEGPSVRWNMFKSIRVEKQDETSDGRQSPKPDPIYDYYHSFTPYVHNKGGGSVFNGPCTKLLKQALS